MSERMNEEKIKKASSSLANVTKAIAQFEREWEGLTSQEKWATGGIIYNLTSIWDDFSSMAVLAMPPVGKALVETLNTFFNRPDLFQGKRLNDQKVKIEG